MKTPGALKTIYYTFPVQLLLLHFRKYQILLVFWLLLFSTVNGDFMHTFGADSLFLAPEYLDNVGPVSASILGVAVGIFTMSWNITTFILFSNQFKFLATTTQPFLKYCLNNSIIPLAFLIYYLVESIRYNYWRELMPGIEVIALTIGFIIGLTGLLAISLLYFFGADRTIMKRLTPIMSNPIKFISTYGVPKNMATDAGLLKVDWYFSSLFKVRKIRNVSHYSNSFLEGVFKQHHVAAVFSILIAFIFLVVIGFVLDYRIFQLPAGASITLFFAILIALSGAFSMLLQTWSIPIFLLMYFFINNLYMQNILDTHNKAYGLHYKDAAPAVYTREALLELCTAEKIAADKQNMLAILEKWKARQTEAKPTLFFLNVSGGGNRSATFTMNVLQKLDSITNGKMMDQTFLITGASGGMIGASYFRELYSRKPTDPSINLQDKKYADDVARDLLNAIFSSFVARDLVSPAQRFEFNGERYVKDRAYAFENRLNDNTRGYLNKTLGQYEAQERNASIPLLFFNSSITRDGKMMLASTQPVSFMMLPREDSGQITPTIPDIVDFKAMFHGHQPDSLSVLTAIRMNATFPYVLPGIWLPTTPAIDVMDAGLRDNFGQETSLRFISYFKDWLNENTSNVVIISIRDRQGGGWEQPYEATNLSDILTKPGLLIQHNWHKLQDYNQESQLSLGQDMITNNITKIAFQYVPRKQENGAALNFHLTKREKKDIAEALDNPFNTKAFNAVVNKIKADSLGR